MSQLRCTKDWYIAELRNTTPRPGKISPLMDVEQGTFFIGLYIGMGNFEVTPLHQCGANLKDAVMTLYQSEELKPSGEPFSTYPGSPTFVRLIYTE